MSEPQPSSVFPSRGHVVFIIFTGKGEIKEKLKDYGSFFDAEVSDDSVHAMIVDPRFNYADIEAYIVELGGEIYIPPEEP